MNLKPSEGRLINIGVNDPAVATGFIIRPRPNLLWHILAFQFLLTTDINAATRGVVISLYNRFCNVGAVRSGFNHPANESHVYLVSSAYKGECETSFGNRCLMCWEKDFSITRDFYISVTVNNMQAGDQISNIRGYAEEFRTK